jgi:hypothetical protein
MDGLGVNAGFPIALFTFFILFWVALFVANIAVWLWGLIDAARRPDWAFNAAGSNKIMWVVLIAVLGAIPSIIYLAAIRSGVRGAEEAWAGRVAPGASWSPSGAFCRGCGAPLGGAPFCTRCGTPV